MRLLALILIIVASSLSTQTSAEVVSVETEIVEEEKPPSTKPVKAKTLDPKGCGPHEPKVIYELLIDIGVPHVSAVQQTGSWQQESRLDQCQTHGDNGVAWGLNSWHEDRRYDMPWGLREQINWAVHIEMKRDCLSCYQQFMAGESVWSVRDAIYRSTRWGHLGNRWIFADQL